MLLTLSMMPTCRFWEGWRDRGDGDTYTHVRPIAFRASFSVMPMRAVCHKEVCRCGIFRTHSQASTTRAQRMTRMAIGQGNSSSSIWKHQFFQAMGLMSRGSRTSQNLLHQIDEGIHVAVHVSTSEFFCARIQSGRSLSPRWLPGG